MLQNIKFCI